MGYTTEFWGEFTVTPALKPEHEAYLTAFSETRRMCRDAAKTALRPDPIREAAGLPVGPDGAYFVGEAGFHGQSDGADVTDGNSPGGGQPGLWCQWKPTAPETIEWDGGEKFYDYVEWLEYLLEDFLIPWGYELNGEVTWEGEDSSDLGKIEVTRNVVKVRSGRVVYE